MVSQHLLKLIIRKILNKKNPKRVMTAENWSLKQGTVNIIETITCFLSIQCKIKANPTFKVEAKQICSIPEKLTNRSRSHGQQNCHLLRELSLKSKMNSRISRNEVE